MIVLFLANENIEGKETNMWLVNSSRNEEINERIFSTYESPSITTAFSSFPPGSVQMASDALHSRRVSPASVSAPTVYARFRLLFDADGPLLPTPGEAFSSPSENTQRDGALQREGQRIPAKGEAIHESSNPPGIQTPHPTPSCRRTDTTAMAPTTLTSSTAIPVPLSSRTVFPIRVFAHPEEVVIPIRQPLSSVTVAGLTREFLGRLQHKHPHLVSRVKVAYYLVRQSEEEDGQGPIMDLPGDRPRGASACRGGRPLRPCDAGIIHRLSSSTSHQHSSSIPLPSSSYPACSSKKPPVFPLEEEENAHYWRIDAMMNQDDTLQDFFWTPSVSVPLVHRYAYLNHERGECPFPGPLIHPCPTYDLVVQWERTNTMDADTPFPPSSRDHEVPRLLATSRYEDASPPLSSKETKWKRKEGRSTANKKEEKGEEEVVDFSSYVPLRDRIRLCEARMVEKKQKDLFFSPPKPVIHVTQRSTYLDLLSMRRSRREEAKEREYKEFLYHRGKELERNMRKKAMKKKKNRKENAEEEARIRNEGATSSLGKDAGREHSHEVHLTAALFELDTAPPKREHLPSTCSSSARSSSSTALSSSFSSRSSSFSSSRSSSSFPLFSKVEVDREKEGPNGGVATHRTQEQHAERVQCGVEEHQQRSRIREEEQFEMDLLMEMESEHCHHLYTLACLKGNAMENGVWLQVIRANRRYPLDTQPIVDKKALEEAQAARRAQSNQSVAMTLQFRQLLEANPSMKPHGKQKGDSVTPPESKPRAESDKGRAPTAGRYSSRPRPLQDEGGSGFRDAMMDKVLEEMEMKRKERLAITCGSLDGYPLREENTEKDDGYRCSAARPSTNTSATLSGNGTPQTSFPLGTSPPANTAGEHSGSTSQDADNDEETTPCDPFEAIAQTEAYQALIEHYLNWRREIITIERKDFREMIGLMKTVLAQQAVVDKAAVVLAYEEELNAAGPFLEWDATLSFASPLHRTDQKAEEGESEDERIEKEEEEKEETMLSNEEVEESDMTETSIEEIVWRGVMDSGEGERPDMKGGACSEVKKEVQDSMHPCESGGERKMEEESPEAFRKRSRDPRYRMVTEAIKKLDLHAGERLEERLAQHREAYRKRKVQERAA